MQKTVSPPATQPVAAPSEGSFLGPVGWLMVAFSLIPFMIGANGNKTGYFVAGGVLLAAGIAIAAVARRASERTARR